MEDFKSLDSKELENIEGGSIALCIAAAIAVIVVIGIIKDL